MRRSPLIVLAALLLPATFSLGEQMLAPVSPAEAPRADARVLRALNSGAERVSVLIGVRDGTPSARQLRLHPDPAGEPARRLVRLQAQKVLAEQMPSEELAVRHFYGSFSLLSVSVTRAALLTLANHPSVDWITLDQTKKPLAAQAQNAVMLIHSDQANLQGATGAGTAVAIVDTGVDYTNPSLGGAPFPNAKVVGGTDIADNDNDPMDCEGHGTSVAAIAASGAGVAPDAKVVAIKVFASKDASNNNCSDTANDSDIISGVDWAITHRTDFGIVAINLSLGGGFEDSQDHGYCDADVPDYTEAFDSAASMGLVVAVASGNDGTANALAAPACVSSAVSVGAVYSQSDASRSWLDDKGAVQCTDAPTAPDQVVCFSDSATSLSMLAPGAFWVVADKGQGNTLFAGTSASSPAVAGAVALMRQVHPTMPPASIIGILRATGALITDPRNGVTTPRLDVLAAVQFDPSAFFPFLGSAPEIPNGSGSASASVTISGFSGSIAGVEVWVEIDHPDPENLRVTLTGPDGTAVVLHDQTGEREHPINAIYGKTDVPAQSLGVFGGRQPNGVWTLTVEDLVTTPGATPGKIRNFAIQLQPGQPTKPIPQNAVGRVLPESAHSQGSKFFLSDISVYNPGNAPRDFSIYYVPAGRTGANASQATKTIAPGQVLALEDLVSGEFGFSDSFGPIFATAKDPNFLIRGRLYTDSVNGSFGHAVPSFATTQGLAMSGGSATANGLIKNDEFHSNVAFTEVSGNPVQVLVEVLDTAGTVLGSTTITAGPNTTPILGDVIKSLGLQPQDSFRVRFTVLSPTGRIIPFATYVDDITGDSIFQPALNPAASAEDVILTQSAHLSGARGDFFTTNVYVTNVDTAPVNLTVSLIPNRLTGTPNPPRTWTLAPGETLTKLDVLVSEFGLQDPSVAGLRLHPDHAARIVVTNNTLVPKFGGTSGYSVQGVPVSTAVAGGKTLTAIGLSASPLATSFRCNFGFIEVAGADAVVRVTARNGDDGSVIGTRDYPLPANTLVQTSSTDLLGGTNASVTNFYLQYQVVSGSGRVMAYATVNDNTSGDGIYVPAE